MDRKDAFVYVINANSPILLQYHISAACNVRLVCVFKIVSKFAVHSPNVWVAKFLS